MVEKVTFDATNKRIIVDYGNNTLDVQADLYSAAKRRWKDDPDLLKLKFPFRTIGGDQLGGELTAGAYFFLQNQAGEEWKIRPYEDNHELNIIGNLYAEDPESPLFLPTIGDYTVLVHLETSSKTQVIRGMAEEDKQDIANFVWEHTTGMKVSERIDLLRKIETGRWKIVKDQMIIYDEDNVTPLLTFNLSGEQKKPYSERTPA